MVEAVSDLRASDWRDLVLWALRRRRLMQVQGESMLPTLAPLARVFVDPHAYRRRPPQPGEIVVARHPYRMDITLIKRVAEVLEDGSCRLVGDNPAASEDSRTYGAVPAHKVIGRVVSR